MQYITLPLLERIFKQAINLNSRVMKTKLLCLVVVALALSTMSVHAQERPFITTWETKTDEERIRIPLNSEFPYNFQYTWKDSGGEEVEDGSGTHTSSDGAFTTQLPTSGIYTLEITGNFPHFFGYPKGKLVDVNQWGDIAWGSMKQSFENWGGTNFTAPDVPDLAQVKDMSLMFEGASSFNGDLSKWNVSNVTNMVRMFTDAVSFNGDLNKWDVSNVTTMFGMFATASSFNQDLNSWNVSNVTNMSFMFADTDIFNGNLSGWNTGNVEDMSSMFESTASFNGDVSTWDVSKVTSMQNMFRNAASFNQDLSSWKVGNVTDMRDMFDGAVSFNGNLSGWNTGKVTDMSFMFNGADSFEGIGLSSWDVGNVKFMFSMFARASSFNQDLSSWNVENVEVMAGMFAGASSFNQGLSSWNVSNVTDMGGMFQDAVSFNGDVSTWDVSQAQNLSAMFRNAVSFNRDLSSWNTALVEDMREMFFGATAFNGDLSKWEVNNVRTMQDMFNGSGLSAENYDRLLAGWAAQEVRNQVKLGASGIHYCEGEAGRLTLKDDHQWDINDAGRLCSDLFITAWQATAGSKEIRIRLNQNLDYNFEYAWRNEAKEEIQDLKGSHTSSDGDFIIELPTPGTYTLEITGSFPHLIGYPKAKLVDVIQWGEIAWGSMKESFKNWGGTKFSATDVPDLAQVTDMGRMFFNATAFNGDLSNWDVGNVENMRFMFEGASSFNGDVSTWNVSKVTDMSFMFSRAVSFNGDLSKWDVNKVTDMSLMFSGAASFNGDVSTWNVSKVTNMQQMFSGASSFNSDLNEWDVSKVTNMFRMFDGASSFNSDLNEWDVSKVTNMEKMFQGAASFNGNVSTWDVSNMGVSNRKDVGSRNVRKKTEKGRMSHMFAGAVAFNRDLSKWDVSSLSGTDMLSMFQGAAAFNSDLSTWDVSGLTHMNSMFEGAVSFNQDLSTWDVSTVGNMSNVFDSSGLSRQNYDRILTSWAAQEVRRGILFGADGVHFCNGEDARDILIDTHKWRITDAGKQCPTDATDIITFVLEGQVGPAAINDAAHTVAIEVLRGTNLAALAPAITLPTGATSSPASGEVVDFTNPVTYTVTAQDGSTTQEWTVVVGRPFITAWQTTASNEEIRIRLNKDLTYNFLYAWKDSAGAVVKSGTHTSSDGPFTTQLPDSGRYSLEISGSFPHFTGYPKARLLDVAQWGDIAWDSMKDSFKNWGGTTFSATDVPDLAKVTDMSGMFQDANFFIGDVSGWNVRNVTTMANMFSGAETFSGNLSDWKVGNVNNMARMFRNARNFNGDVSGWSVSSVNTMNAMFDGSGLSTENYDRLLAGWEAQKVRSRVKLGAEGIKFCNGEAARDILINVHEWVITDAGRECPEGAGTTDIITFVLDEQAGPAVINDAARTVDIAVVSGTNLAALAPTITLSRGATSSPASGQVVDFTSPVTYTVTAQDGNTTQEWTVTVRRPFITAWQTEAASEQIRIPLNPNLTYSFRYAWKDLTGTVVKKGSHTSSDGAFTTQLPISGTYALEITGDFPHFFGYPKTQLLDVNQWGDIAWGSMKDSFFGWPGEKFSATDVPDLARVTDMRGMFQNAGSFNGDLSTWEVSNVKTMANMFRGAASFNGDLSDWEVSKVEQMTGMFLNAKSFKGKGLSGWNTANVRNMSFMFFSAASFNGDISGWEVSKVQIMANMFEDARSFNRDLSKWEISQVKNMERMFDGSGLSRQNYDRLLVGWAAQPVLQKNVKLGAKGINFCNGADAHRTLRKDYNWAIDDAGEQCPTDATDIIAFTLEGQAGPAVINDAAHTVDIAVVSGTDLAALAPEITLSSGATSSPASGQVVDFTGPVIYTVTAQNGTTTQEWTVTVSSREVFTQTLDGNEGWRTLSAPASGRLFKQLLAGFWTQGFAGASTPNGQPNLYHWDIDAQDWAPFTDLATDSLPAGHGFLFFVYSDDNFDRVPEGFPKTLQLDNSAVVFNSGEITPVSGLDDKAFFFAGNPYGYPIDWEALTRNGLSETVYVHGNEGWKSWNGSVGNLNDGEIAAFQGFFVQGLGGNGELTIELEDTVSTTVDLEKAVDVPAKPLKITAKAGELTADAWLSFQPGGQLGRDSYDGLALASLDTTFLRLATILDSGQALAINALPADQSEPLVFPLELSGRAEEKKATLSFEGVEAFEEWRMVVLDTQSEMEYPVAEGLVLEVDTIRIKKSGFTGTVTPAEVRYRLILEPLRTGTEQGISGVPERVELQQNYPNPFNPATVISYGVPQAGPVRLEVFDLVGRKVATLLERESQGPGRYEVRFDASTLASGVYIYRLQVGSSVLTRKMTLIK